MKQNFLGQFQAARESPASAKAPARQARNNANADWRNSNAKIWIYKKPRLRQRGSTSIISTFSFH
jgi:hypothetical protein